MVTLFPNPLTWGRRSVASDRYRLFPHQRRGDPVTRFLGAAAVAALACGPGGPARADADDDAKAILDKAIKALGSEEKLAAVQAATWKSRGTIRLGGNNSDFTSQTIVQGLDRFRQEFEGDFGGNKVKNVTV